MTVIATALKHLIAAGVSGDDLVRAVAEMEAAQGAKVDAVAEKRRAYDRERKRAKKAQTDSTGIPPESTETAERVSPKEYISNPLPEPVEPSGSTSPCRFSVEDAVAAWNETAGRCGLNKAKTISPDRRKAISARLKATGEEGWREALAGVERSKFCRGENDRGFRADLDFVAQPKSFNRLREGFYGTDADEPGKVVQLDPTARADTMERTAVIYDKQGRDREAAQIRQEAARLRKSVSIGDLVQRAIN